LPITEWKGDRLHRHPEDRAVKAETAFALPGIVIHELSHYLLCRLCGAKVQEVVFFDPDGRSGYVVHSVPRHLVQHGTIVIGPLLLNSVLGFLLFRAVTTQVGDLLSPTRSPGPLAYAQAALLTFLGASISLHALPSQADASSLWRVTLERVGQGQLLAILAAPIALLLMAANQLRRYWIDWLYAAALAGLALWLPLG
jgi:hypothetical protein